MLTSRASDLNLDGVTYRERTNELLDTGIPSQITAGFSAGFFMGYVSALYSTAMCDMCALQHNCVASV